MGLMPPAKLKNMLRVWGQEILQGVRRLVVLSLAPAAALAVLSSEQPAQQYDQGS